MTLWITWLQAVRSLRPACRRSRTFLWMVLILMGLCCRLDLAGVTSFVRVMGLRPLAYHRLLHLFHSHALDLDGLTACWVRLCLTLFQPFLVGSRLVCLADGIKAPKEGRKMPGVKLLHQESGNNTKPEYIMGHSIQSISLLVQGPAGHAAAVPLTSRIHEGLVFSNRDTRTLLDKLVALPFSLTRVWNRQIMLVADAYYASGKLILALNHTADVWRAFRSWLRTMNPALPPSERVVANALRSGLPGFIAAPLFDPGLAKIMAQYRRHDPDLDTGPAAA